MHLLHRNRSDSDSDDLSLKKESVQHFLPSVQFQIAANGLDLCDFSCPKAEPTPIYRISSDTGAAETSPEYVSLRPKAKSNSCALVDGPSQRPLMATVYRWGPGRNPRMRILPPSSSLTVEQAVEGIDGDEFEVSGTNVFSRTKRMVTPYGAFAWRYGNRREREAAGAPHSLLILDKLDQEAGSEGVRVAQLVRNDEFRTPGTNKRTGGNGGRLQISWQAWNGEGKVKSKELEAFVVASCICMLKKEVDRMKDNQVVVVTA